MTEKKFLELTNRYFNSNVTLSTKIGSVLTDSAQYVAYIMYIEDKLNVTLPDDVVMKASVFNDLFKKLK